MTAPTFEWETIDGSGGLDDRAPVPGGWLYRTWNEFLFPDGRAGDWRPVAMVFVPDPDAERGSL